jgi:hypothetical protein
MATNKTQPDPKSKHPRVPGDDATVPRVLNEPLDERESSFITATSLFGIVAGAAIGGVLGLIAAAFPGINWWTGLMVGAIAGATAAAFITTRLGIRALDDESLPPAVKHGGEARARRPRVR